ncbi:MAG: tetratricopeptide repeat protein [Terriglobia bacterium]
MLVDSGGYAEGVSYLERARAANPGSWGVYFYLGKANLRLRHDGAAVQLLRRAADLNPGEPAVFYLLGSALRAEGENKAAQSAFARLAELHASQLDAEARALHNSLVFKYSDK